MRIKRILLRHIRRHNPGLLIDELSDDLNVIGGHNEEGKSSLLMALRCALFLSHGTTGQLREKLVPYGGTGTPEIELDFEIAGKSVQMVKPFKKDGMQLQIGDKLWRNAQAEAELEQLLRFQRPDKAPRKLKADHFGLTGLFWVEQGTSFEPVEIASDGQRRLGDLLSSEIGQVAAGDGADQVLESATERYGVYWTAQGRAKGAGPLADAQARLEDALKQERQLADQLKSLKDTIEQMAKLRALNQQVIEDDQEGRLRSQLTDAQARAARLAELDQMHALKKQALALAQRAQTDAVQARDQRLTAIEDIKRLEQALNQAQLKRQTLADAVSLADAERERLERDLKAKMDNAKETAKTLRDAERHEACMAVQKRLEQQRQLYSALTGLDAQIRDLKALIAANPLSDQLLLKLKNADRSWRDARVALLAIATRIEFTPEHGRAVTVDGQIHDPSKPLDLSEPSNVELEGFGQIRVVPGGDEIRVSRRQVSECEAHYEELAQSAGIESLDQGEALARERQDALTKHKQLMAERDRLLNGVTIQEVAQIIEELEVERAKFGQSDYPPSNLGDEALALDGLRLRNQSAVDAAESARAHWDVAAKAYQEARQKHAVDDALLAEQSARLTALQKQLEAERGLNNDDALLRSLEAANQEHSRLALELTQLGLASKQEDASVLGQEIEMYRNSIKDLAKEMQIRRDRQLELELIIQMEGAKGIGERHEAAKGRVDAAQTEVEALQRDASALKLLLETLKDEQKQLKDRFTGPVRERLLPMIRRVLPDAMPVVDSQSITLGSIERSGISEDLDDLSIGTREQLAILVRLAFADLLAEHEGEAPPIILDDALVYADELRFRDMKLLLQDAAKRHQIIILACRPRDYHGLNAKTYDLASCKLTGT